MNMAYCELKSMKEYKLSLHLSIIKEAIMRIQKKSSISDCFIHIHTLIPNFVFHYTTLFVSNKNLDFQNLVPLNGCKSLRIFS